MADYKGKYTGAELDNILSVIKLDGGGDKVLADNGKYVDLPREGLPILPYNYSEILTACKKNDQEFFKEICSYPEGIYLIHGAECSEGSPYYESAIVRIYHKTQMSTEYREISRIVKIDSEISNQYVYIYKHSQHECVPESAYYLEEYSSTIVSKANNVYDSILVTPPDNAMIGFKNNTFIYVTIEESVNTLRLEDSINIPSGMIGFMMSSALSESTDSKTISLVYHGQTINITLKANEPFYLKIEYGVISKVYQIISVGYSVAQTSLQASDSSK